MVEGSCTWKLSSGNLYTFITPNQGTAVKKETVGPWQELDLRFRCSTLTNRGQLSSSLMG
jgi:hypothetical protein